jgi:aryl-alcohol dehydrogenase-like predicted oxidoreductase
LIRCWIEELMPGRRPEGHKNITRLTHLDDGTAIAAVERAFELGINLLDTSPLYGHGLSEHRCGTAIRRVSRQDMVVCTKVGRWMDPFHGPSNGSGFVGGQPHRGWEGRDSRSVMLLEQERAGVKIAADPERVKQAAERAKSG